MHTQKKKRLLWHIFPLFLIVVILSLSFVAYYSTHYFKNFFIETFEKELTIRTKLLQNSFVTIFKERKNNQPHYIDNYCKNIGKKTDTRVTLILPAGIVAGDSFADTKTMENHIQRPEVRQALKRKKGISIRYSSTLDKDMMYIALPVINDNLVTAVIRTAVSVSVIDTKITSIRNNIMAALLLSIIAASMAGLYVAKKVTRPIELMKEGAVQFAKGNLQARLAVPDTLELSQLAVTMNQMAVNLDEKIDAFKNRSMELEAVHASMQEGVIAIDNHETIITVNDAAARVLVFPAQHLKGSNILEVARNVEFQKFIKQALATHEPFEDNITVKRDNIQILNMHSTALYDSLKNRMGTLIIFHDITRIKKLETLHKDFAANVSHELQTPLTTINGFIETLKEMPSSNNAKEREKFLNIIEKNVKRMIDLINDLLSLSKLERKQGTNIQFEKLDIKTTIENALMTCDRSIREKNIKINLECPENSAVMMDPILMEQAIVNLVDNAVKYSYKGKGIDITVLSKDQSIEITVKDYGIGIDKEHLSKIFNRFYRADKSRSRKKGGTGLGLAIVKHIAQYHNGKIEVKSQINYGSSFKITIPV
jgi:two-component system, OmpR family, phosphate regulon sensor histidine kinase PhoR